MNAEGLYSEAYLELVHKICNVIADVGLSSDFICGKQFLSVINIGLPFSEI
jgi:hypothetical protein